MKVPYSPETIGRHERGEVDFAPADAVFYADGYQAPDILYRYCSDCPVGQKTGRKATDRPLPYATLRVRRMVEDAQAVTAGLPGFAFLRLLHIAEEGAAGPQKQFLVLQTERCRIAYLLDAQNALLSAARVEIRRRTTDEVYALEVLVRWGAACLLHEQFSGG